MSLLHEIVCSGAIIHTNFLLSNKVKHVAISTDWLVNIQDHYNKMNPQTRTEYEQFGVTFDQRLVLILIKPIQYSNLKSSDVNNVSFA